VEKVKHKGIVVEIAPKNKVIILTPQGEFLKIPFHKHVQVGQEIRYTPRKERLNVWQLSAAAVLFLTLLGSWPMISERLVPQSAVPAFIVTLDLDSSFELAVSSDRKVLSVEGLNRNGRELAQNLDVVGADLRSAVQAIAAKAGGAKQAVVTVAAVNGGAASVKEKSSEQYSGVEREVADALRSARLADVRIWEVPRSFQTEAKLAGISPSRYMALQQPSGPVVPLKIETRLTMSDPPALEEKAEKVAASTAVAQRIMEPLRPELTPTRWTRQSADASQAGIHSVSFPIAAVKGDF
jgi:hypothetical protein